MNPDADALIREFERLGERPGPEVTAVRDESGTWTIGCVAWHSEAQKDHYRATATHLARQADVLAGGDGSEHRWCERLLIRAQYVNTAGQITHLPYASVQALRDLPTAWPTPLAPGTPKTEVMGPKDFAKKLKWSVDALMDAMKSGKVRANKFSDRSYQFDATMLPKK